MSQRTIVEINHDVPGLVSEELAEALYGLLMNAVRTGFPEDWEPLRRFGFTRITQCHHSEDRKVVVSNREYIFG
jgi:hypothetical protein